MAQRSHIGHRSKYIEFRFQQSLRKYEPPPRKLIKIGSSVCHNCDRKSCESRAESRLIRLCETRKLYQLTSRQKASEFSRKKEALQTSQEKASGHVSDFNCNENNNVEDMLCQSQKQNGQQGRVQQNASSAHKQRTKNEWQICIKQTPVKQYIREQLKLRQSECKEIIEQKEKQESNCTKVKDIQFHIGLVEQLHKKINEYIKLESGSTTKSNNQNAMSMEQEQSKQPQHAPIYFGSIGGQNNWEQSQLTSLQSFYEQPVAFSWNDLRFDQVVIQHSQWQSEKPIQSSPSANQAKLRGEKSIGNNLTERVGRIQINGEKGRFLLSARIMNRLITSQISPVSLKKTVLRHHPYLEDFQSLLKQHVGK